MTIRYTNSPPLSHRKPKNTLHNKYSDIRFQPNFPNCCPVNPDHLMIMIHCTPVSWSPGLPPVNPAFVVLFVSGDNILTAVSVARQCGLVPAGDKLVFVNAYSPGDGEPARIDWRCHDDGCHGDAGMQSPDAASSSQSPQQVVSFFMC